MRRRANAWSSPHLSPLTQQREGGSLVSDILSPATDWELQTMVAALASEGTTLEVVGAASKRAIGRPISSDRVVTTSVLRGIPLYESTELVMSTAAQRSWFPAAVLPRWSWR